MNLSIEEYIHNKNYKLSMKMIDEINCHILSMNSINGFTIK